MSEISEDWKKRVMERLDDLEARLSSIEKSILTVGKKPATKKEFSGLSGGVRKLIHEGFLDTPKSLKQIMDELRRQMYYYPVTSVNTAITRDFMKTKGLLTRIGKKGQWKYVLKK